MSLPGQWRGSIRARRKFDPAAPAGSSRFSPDPPEDLTAGGSGILPAGRSNEGGPQERTSAFVWVAGKARAHQSSKNLGASHQALSKATRSTRTQYKIGIPQEESGLSAIDLIGEGYRLFSVDVPRIAEIRLVRLVSLEQVVPNDNPRNGNLLP
jgi:hypothetical protein